MLCSNCALKSNSKVTCGSSRKRSYQASIFIENSFFVEDFIMKNFKLKLLSICIIVSCVVATGSAVAQETGACCNPQNGMCYMSTQEGCYYEWLGPGTNCSMCELLGACCDQMTGNCYESSQSDCIYTWIGGMDCGICMGPPPVPGACCNWDTGACYMLLQEECKSPYQWLGPGTDCSMCAPEGACCYEATGDCYMSGESECIIPYTWLGIGSDCSMCVLPWGDFGDAPEGSNAVAYPATGVKGAFPTCTTIGPVGWWIQHVGSGAWFGSGNDFEGEGNGGLCPGCFPPYDQDECFGDGDAGLIIPQPYTIDATLNVVPCPQCGGTPLGDICQTAVWGTNIDIEVHNHMPNQTIGYVNLLIDWDQNGQWGGASNCPTAATPEHALVNFPVPNPYDGQLSGLMPIGAGFLIGPNRGYVWARFTITEVPVPEPWDGSGIFEDGETEDYLLEIGRVYEPKPLVEHSKWSQPPIEINPQSRTPEYCGWDEKSFREYIEPMWFDAWDCRTQCHGDADCDGDVDPDDVLIVQNAFGSVYPDPMYDPRADFNRDLRINATDMTILKLYLGTHPPADCGQRPQSWTIVADDFRCIGNMPITSIHWWGSYIDWQYPDPPAVKPTSWRIGFWSNVDGHGGYSCRAPDQMDSATGTGH